MLPDRNSHQSFECNAPDVIFENFGDETVLLNLESGKYYSLNPLAMYFWEVLCQGVAPSEIAAHIAGSYNGNANAQNTGIQALGADLGAMVEQMLSEGLIRPSSTSRAIADAASTQAGLPTEFSPPAIAAYDDVAELLLLDPVHEVGELGWPDPAPPKQERE